MTQMTESEIRRLKEEALAKSLLPYPHPVNRAQRRANESHTAKRDKLKAMAADTPYKMKPKSQRR